MADKVLNSALNGHIPLKDILAWITNKNLEPEQILEFDCSRGDFVLFFLNFLRQGTARAAPLPKCFQISSRSSRKTLQTGLSSENFPAQRTYEKSNTLLSKPSTASENEDCSVNSDKKIKLQNSLDFSNTRTQEGKKIHTGTLVEGHSLSLHSELSHDSPRKLSPQRVWKENGGENPNQERDSMVTSSPVSHNFTLDLSPHLTPIQKRFQASKSHDMRSPGFTSGSPDHGNRNSHKSTSFCLGDFIIKDGRGQKNHAKKRISTSPPKSPADLQCGLSDDIQPSSSQKKKHRRRINPTKVCVESVPSQPGFNDVQAFGSVSQSRSITSPFQEPVSLEHSTASSSFTEERNLLKQERLKLQGDQSITQKNIVSQTPLTKFSVQNFVNVAKPSEISFLEELLKCSSIYCSILDANFVPNIMSELYFVLQMLVIQDHHLETAQDLVSVELENALENLSVDKSTEESAKDDMMNQVNDYSSSQSQCGLIDRDWKSIHLFSSIHNCVFFGTKVLFHLREVLGCLDRITLKLLMENERIIDFTPELSEYLAVLYTSASSSFSSSNQVSSKSAVNSNVAFQSETDNSSNFPCAQSFSSFRKQRDGFYDLIRVWEANHMSPGWCFTSALASRVRNLLQLCSNPTNYIHLARLFRLQLIATVHGDHTLCDEESCEDSKLQECLRGVDPDKLNRLRERLVTPHKSAGPRPPPSFPGVQEFFRDFIICSYNSLFMQHLQDGLVSHLLELNEVIFVASDMEESDSSVDGVTRREYISTMSTMQVLAKFLGFAVFYPYSRPEGKLTEKIKETEIKLRSKVSPPINILGCVLDAHKSHRLIVTVPWVVKYLGMLDVVSCALPFYNATLRLLLHIYINLSHSSNVLIGQESGHEQLYSLPTYSVLLLRMCLGWLFEASTIQETVFYSSCFNLDESILMDNLNWRHGVISELSLTALTSGAGASITSNTGPPVDALNLVDTQVLYALCPYLLELRALLTTVPATRSTPGNPIRHITPVSTSFSATSPSSTPKQLELQLEESFFHNLPASVHRTVEFVQERVTSLCVKHICNVWLRSLKEQGIVKIRQKIQSCWDDLDNMQDTLMKEVQAIVDEVSAELKVKCRTGINEVCLVKCKGALSALLSEESLSPAVCEMCIAIATRICVERVVVWMQTHATLSMFSKELQNEIEKAVKHRDRSDMVAMAKTSHIAPGSNAAWTHNDVAPSPFEVLQALKLLVCTILDGQETSREVIEDVLDRIKLTVLERQDVVPAAERVLALLSVDLVVALACYFPSLLDSTLLNRMINLWKLDALRPVEDGLARLVCPRNMLLLAQSHLPPRIVWEKLADVVVAVLKAELVTPDLVENQCLAIMQQEWPQNILRCFSMCMTEVVRQYQKQRDVDYKFVLLLEWLAETMAQIDYFPDL